MGGYWSVEREKTSLSEQDLRVYPVVKDKDDVEMSEDHRKFLEWLEAQEIVKQPGFSEVFPDYVPSEPGQLPGG